MIRVAMYKNKEGHYYKYKAEGHANYAKKGEDIVCAAVSALTQTMAITLGGICDITNDMITDKGSLDVTVIYEDAELKEVQTLFQALKNGMKAIEFEYPEYVKLEIITP